LATLSISSLSPDATNTAPLRFAVVGCGALARTAHIPTIARSPEMRLQVCCDLSDKALAECQERWGAGSTTNDYRDAISRSDVDVVCLATTEKLRLPVIDLAVKLKKPLYVEKPVAQSLDELYEIQRIVKESGIAFCVGHNRRCSPAMVDAHRIFRAHVDSPQSCEWRWDREGDQRPNLPENGLACMAIRINDDWYSWKRWVFDKMHAPHGPMLFEMTHFTDLCNWFLAATPEEVFAVETGMLTHAIIIRYATGELATITMCANGTFGYGKELYEVMGQGALVAIDHMVEVRTAGIPDAAPSKSYPLLNDRHPDVGADGGIAGWLSKKRAACDEASAKNDPLLQFAAEPDKGHAHILRRFCDEVRGRAKTVCGIDDAVMATRVAFAAVRSAAEHRPVQLAEV
jgi:predicted dehydrogenase